MQVCRRDHPWAHRSWSADEVPKVGEVVRTRETVLPGHCADRETVVVEVRDLDHGYYEIGLELSGAHARTWFAPDELTTQPRRSIVTFHDEPCPTDMPFDLIGSARRPRYE